MPKRAGKEPKSEIAEEFFKELGLGGLIDRLKRSEVFRKRMEEVNRQIEENLERGVEGGQVRPRVRYGFSMRTLTSRPSQGLKERWTPRGRQGREKQPQEPEPFVETFDEGGFIDVIATFPGVEEEQQLKVEVKENVLLLSAGSYREEIELPGPVRGKPQVRFKNGVFGIKLEKQGQDNGRDRRKELETGPGPGET
ncbi:MAG: hypothetical protein ACE5JP_08890 [Candidatus Bipolaricaulia bacterium]